MSDILCLHRWWLVASDCRSETCGDCGALCLLPQGAPSFIAEEQPEPIGDCPPMTDKAFIRLPA